MRSPTVSAVRGLVMLFLIKFTSFALLLLPYCAKHRTGRQWSMMVTLDSHTCNPNQAAAWKRTPFSTHAAANWTLGRVMAKTPKANLGSQEKITVETIEYCIWFQNEDKPMRFHHIVSIPLVLWYLIHMEVFSIWISLKLQGFQMPKSNITLTLTYIDY